MIGNLYRKTQPRNLRGLLLDSPPYFIDCFGLLFDTYYVYPPNTSPGLLNPNVVATNGVRLTSVRYDFVVFSMFRDQQAAFNIKTESYIPSIAVLQEEELWPAAPVADYYVIPDESYLQMYNLPKDKTAVIDPPVHFLIEKTEPKNTTLVNVEKWTDTEFTKFKRICGSIPVKMFSTINSKYCNRVQNLQDLCEIYKSGKNFISYQCPKVRDFEAATSGLNIFYIDRDNNPEVERRKLLDFVQNPSYTELKSNFRDKWPEFIRSIL